MKTMTRIPRVSTRMCGPARALKSYDCAIISRHAAFRIQTDPAPHPSPLGNLFSALLVFVAQTASLSVAARILGIALLASLSLGVLPARAQDDDAKEKAREQQEKRELEKEKREQERESERAYQKARKLVDKGQ